MAKQIHGSLGVTAVQRPLDKEYEQKVTSEKHEMGSGAGLASARRLERAAYLMT